MEKIIQDRTKKLAVDVWRLCQGLSNDFYDYKRQLIRCSSSVGANYRAACRSKSGADFLNKLKIVEEELDETMFFIELITEINSTYKQNWSNVYSESEQLLKIIVKSISTTRNSLNINKEKSNKSKIE